MKPRRSTLLLWGFYALLVAICLMLWVQMGREDLGRFDTMAWDYVNLYTGGSMALHGQGPAVYDLGAQAAWQAALLYPRHFTGGILPFRYAPTILPILIPLALVPLRPSYLLWLAGSAAVAAACFLLLQAHLRLGWTGRLTLLLAFLSFYPLSSHLWQGQTALLVLLGFVLAYVAWRRGNEFWAGAALALGTIKPTLLLLPLVVLLVKRRWRTLAGFSAATAGLLLPTLPLLGLRGVWGFVTMTLAGLGWNDVYGVTLRVMHNWRAFTLQLLGDGPAGLVLLAGLNLLSLAAIAWTWRGPWEPSRRRFPRQIAVTILVTTLTSPHLYMHDLVLWLLAGALIAYAGPPLWPRWLPLALLVLGSAAPAMSAVLPGPVGPPTVLVAAATVAWLLQAGIDVPVVDLAAAAPQAARPARAPAVQSVAPARGSARAAYATLYVPRPLWPAGKYHLPRAPPPMPSEPPGALLELEVPPRGLWGKLIILVERRSHWSRSVRNFVRTKYVTLALPSEARHGADIHQLPVVIAPARS